jgi:polysaccharide export outer membrane protein
MKKTILIQIFICFILTCIFVVPSFTADSETYKIRKGDILDISTWKEVDFTKEEIFVRIDGKITFPLLNDIQAAGKTPVQLKDEITKGLSKYVESPMVTVSIRSAASQRYYILGEVLNPGEYPITKELTVLQTLAIAGGFGEWASKKEIILERRENGKDRIYKINYKDIIKGKGFDQNIVIQADDTIIVP